MKLLSIAVPCYNSQAYMRKCINSLLIGGDMVEIIIVNDGSKDDTPCIAEEYASKYPGTLFSTSGVHPHDAKTCNGHTMFELEKISKNDCVVAIGECGLDYNRNYSPQPVQRKWFEKQIELAEELNMPLFLHDRESYDDFAKIMKKHKQIASNSVVHCFTGTKYEAEDYLDLGCYIGITGWICDERRNDDLLKAIKIVINNSLNLIGVIPREEM